MKKILSTTCVLFTLMCVTTFSGCSNDHNKDKVSVIKMYVSAETGEYTIGGEVPSELIGTIAEGMQIKEEGSNTWQAVHFLTIQHFGYQKGYEYVLKVKKTILENPPMDGSNIKYELIEIISKEYKGILSPEMLKKTFVLQSSPELLLADRVLCKESLLVSDLTAEETAVLTSENETKEIPGFALEYDIRKGENIYRIKATCIDEEYATLLKKKQVKVTYKWGVKSESHPLKWNESMASELHLNTLEDNTTIYLKVIDENGNKSKLVFIRISGSGIYEPQIRCLIFNNKEEMYSERAIQLLYEYTSMPLVSQGYSHTNAKYSPTSAIVMCEDSPERKITWNSLGYIREIIPPAEKERILSLPNNGVLIYKLVLLNFAGDVIQEIPVIAMHKEDFP